MYTPITPTNCSFSGNNAWVDIDCSGMVPPEAVAVVFRYTINALSGGFSVVGYRPNGMTAGPLGIYGTVAQAWGIVGLDEARVFEAYRYTADVVFTVFGYLTAEDGVFFTGSTPPEISPSTTNTWLDIDISAHTNGDAAAAVLMGQGTVSYGYRRNGSTDNRFNSGNVVHGAVVGLDADQVFEHITSGSISNLYLYGYLYGNSAFALNAPDVSLGGTGTWTDMSALPVGAVAGIYETRNVGIDGNHGFRTNGSSESVATNMPHAWAIVGCDENRVVEQYISSTTADAWLTGYLTTSQKIRRVGSVTTDVATAVNTTRNTSHTVPAGSNRLLVYLLGIEDGSAVPAAAPTFNGASMTLVDSIVVGSTKVYMYYLVAPDEGTYNISVTFTNECDDFACAAINFVGVDQSSPLIQGDATSDSTSPYANSVTTSNTDTLIIGGGCISSGSASPFTSADLYATKFADITNGPGDSGAISLYGNYRIITAGGTYDLGATGSASTTGCHVYAEFRAATVVSGDADVPVSGVSATGAVGNVTTSFGATVSVTGLEATSGLGTPQVAVTVTSAVDGVSATGHVGSVTVAHDYTHPVDGLAGTASLGTITVAYDFTHTLSGVQATASLGTVDTTQGATTPVTGLQATASLGSVVTEYGGSVSPSGVAASAVLGSVVASISATVSVTTIAGTTALGTVTVEAVDGEFTPLGVVFDGSNDYLETDEPPLSGVADSYVGLYSVWVNLGRSTNEPLLSDGGSAFISRVDETGKLEILLFGYFGSILASVDNALSTGEWHHILASWDTNAEAGQKTFQLYIDDQPAAFTLTDEDNAFEIVYSVGYNYQFGLQYIDDILRRYEGAAAEIYFNCAERLDLTVEANRRKFITAEGKPASLGADGSEPTGNKPLVYLSYRDGGSPADIAINRSGAGDFAVVGSLTQASTPPAVFLPSVFATGVAGTAALGTVSVTVDAAFAATGVSGSAALGNVNVSTSLTLVPTGLEAAGGLGAVTLDLTSVVLPSGVSATALLGSVSAFTGTSVSVSGVQGTTALGDISVHVPLIVSGVSATGEVGDVLAVIDATILVSGTSATVSLGNATVGGLESVVASGLGATLSLGEVTVQSDMNFSVAGLSMTISIGDVKLVGWFDLADGEAEVWTAPPASDSEMWTDLAPSDDEGWSDLSAS